tara:strand:+ start:112 stop:864 length:753 start_codon:yes stop_codon:yes gene_type:complete
MASKDIHPEDLGEFIVETKLKRSMKVKETMVEDIKGGDYGQIKGVTGTFLLISGAAKLADDFGYYAVLKELKEEALGEGNLKITTTLDIMDVDGKQIGSGVGTWDTTERGLPDRQRGMAISYKRAFVLGIRYACNAFGLFSQDEDIVKRSAAGEVAGVFQNTQGSAYQRNDSQDQGKDQSYSTLKPCKEDENGVWIVTMNMGSGAWQTYKGKELIDVVKNDTAWANWCLEKSNLDPDCKKAIVAAAEGKL